MPRPPALSALVAASCLVVGGAAARAKMMAPRPRPIPVFAMAPGPAAGGERPAPAAPAFLRASAIAAAGQGALVSDPDSGALVLADAAGAPIASLPIGPGAGLLAYDPQAGRAYVADRAGDRVVVVAVGQGLEVVAAWPTPAEPYAVALAPDRRTVLVAAIADRALVALDAATGRPRWRVALPAEPRGLAISPDGARALVATLAAGGVVELDLTGARRAAPLPLAPVIGPGRCASCDAPAYARGAAAVTYAGDRLAVVPFQREVPVQGPGGNPGGGYGGGEGAPITSHLALLARPTGAPAGRAGTQATAQIADVLVRAVAWDGARDRLLAVGLGSDTLLVLSGASTRSIAFAERVALTDPATPLADRCGPDGVATSDGGDALVWCAFARRVLRVRPGPAGTSEVVAGPTLVASRLSAEAHRGMVAFHAATTAVSSRGALACASCHPDGRADGLTWKLGERTLQTPVLAGRVVGTQPYKWDGGDPDLAASLASTVERLGGDGLDDEDARGLAAYLAALPAPRPPTREAGARARGRQVFDAAGCRACHDGPAYADGERHAFRGSLPAADTPSLVGLAASAPFYHDGSAPTLDALLRGAGRVHGMPDGRGLTAAQRRDLVAFLESL